MSTLSSLPRLWAPAALHHGAQVALDDARAHYLRHVMRLSDGASLSVFNGTDGEWRASLQTIGKRGAALLVQSNLRPPKPEPGPWLLFAPVKRAATDLILVKAVELGVERIQPIQTRRTNAERINHDRLTAQAIEAAEQCERLTLPTIAEIAPFESLLASWPAERRLFIADESGARSNEATIPSLAQAVAGEARGRPWALAIGPEGGWAQGELDAFRDSAFVTAIAMGPRVLRAETAALAGLAVLQALLGDW
ncbi:MAG: 16S rRNA (uracil(1498)-N(3))-methyltransferase [Elsteraceae bacterium]